MCKIAIEEIRTAELVKFLYAVDDYFSGTLSHNCKCASLDEWANKLMKTARFVTARNTSEELVGCAIFYPNSGSDYVYLNILAVLREYGGRGIATKLITHLKGYAGDNRRAGLKLECHKDNERALALYKKHGFKPIGTIYPSNDYKQFVLDL